jgi:HJR/Mrr/RecB family endonuclease
MRKPKPPKPEDYGTSDGDIREFRNCSASDEFNEVRQKGDKRTWRYVGVWVVGLAIVIFATGGVGLVMAIVIALVVTLFGGVFIPIWAQNIVEHFEWKKERPHQEIKHRRIAKVEAYLAAEEEYQAEFTRYEGYKQEQALKRQQKKEAYWKNQSGVEFEASVEKLFSDLGYITELTPQTADGGVDIVLRNGNEKIAVQCKRYKSRVAAGHMREFIGAMKALKYKKGMFITVEGVTGPSQKLADENNIEVLVAADLVRLRKKAS